MTKRIMLLPNPPELSDEMAVAFTEFLFDIAMAAEMHYGQQLRRYFHQRTHAPCDRDDDDEPF